MRCAEVISAAGPYRDGELAAAIAVRIAEHLASCATCRDSYDRERDSERRIARALRSPPDDGDERRWAAILQRALPTRIATRRSVPWTRIADGRMAWIAMAASLALLAALSSAGIGLRHGGHLPMTSTAAPNQYD